MPIVNKWAQDSKAPRSDKCRSAGESPEYIAGNLPSKAKGVRRELPLISSSFPETVVFRPSHSADFLCMNRGAIAPLRSGS